MVNANPHVLVVDDDPTVADVVTRYLEREGMRVDTVVDGLAALECARKSVPDLVVLDVMLPGIDGLEVCRRLQAMAHIPIIMLTARGDEAERIAGLELGADDYIAKPFSPRELVARVRAVLRRAQAKPIEPGGADVFDSRGLALHMLSREVTLSGHAIALTALEFDLLACFMQHPRQVFRREDLLERVWGFSSGDTSTVTVHVRRLREKIETDPAAPERVKTVWGVGYRFEP